MTTASALSAANGSRSRAHQRRSSSRAVRHSSRDFTGAGIAWTTSARPRDTEYRRATEITRKGEWLVCHDPVVLRSARVALVAIALVATAASAQPKAQRAWVSVPRCAYAASPLGRYGIYVIQGRVSCAEAAFILYRAWTEPGISSGDCCGFSRFRDGWVCQANMGVSNCFYPY